MFLKTIEVAIGVAFLYVLLTFAASAIVELVSNIRGWRGKMLRRGIANMLTGSPLKVDDVYSNALIVSLQRDPKPILNETRGLASYIPAATFSAVVLDELRHCTTDGSK